MSNHLRICFIVLTILVSFTLKLAAEETPGNLLRNGSFEGGMRCWYYDMESHERHMYTGGDITIKELVIEWKPR